MAFPSNHKPGPSEDLAKPPAEAEQLGPAARPAWERGTDLGPRTLQLPDQAGLKARLVEAGVGTCLGEPQGRGLPNSRPDQPGSCQAIRSQTLCVCLCAGGWCASQAMWVAASCGVVTWPSQQASGSPVVSFTSDIWSSSQLASFLHGHFYFPSPKSGGKGPHSLSIPLKLTPW